MTDGMELEKLYKESLEENLVEYIAEKKKLSFEDAMDRYYKSNMSSNISDGRYGIQYLDYRHLGELLFETEPELF